MDNKYSWNLKEIFESDEALENDVKALYDLLETLKLFKGKLANNVDEMVNYFKTLERALEIYNK